MDGSSAPSALGAFGGTIVDDQGDDQDASTSENATTTMLPPRPPPVASGLSLSREPASPSGSIAGLRRGKQIAKTKLEREVSGYLRDGKMLVNRTSHIKGTLNDYKLVQDAAELGSGNEARGAVKKPPLLSTALNPSCWVLLRRPLGYGSTRKMASSTPSKRLRTPGDPPPCAPSAPVPSLCLLPVLDAVLVLWFQGTAPSAVQSQPCR